MSEEMSRRDFLRRSGKQAVKDGVEIGSRIVPGGAVVRRIIEEKNADGEFVEPNRKPWWDKLVNWKHERQSGQRQ